MHPQMSKSIIYYITGHGFGHARRSAALIRRLVADQADLTVHIRTAAAREVFADTIGARVVYEKTDIDPGAIEDDAIRVNQAKTIDRLRRHLRLRQPIIGGELRRLPRDLRLIVADITFFGGDISARAGVPGIAIGNFTWDWIYEPWLASHNDGAQMLGEIQASYSKFTAILKLPFGGRTGMFREVIDAPVIATGQRYTRGQVLEQLHIEDRPGRPIILIGQRGGISASALERVIRGSPGVTFLFPNAPPECAHRDTLVPVQLDGRLRFADLLYASDAVVSKLGHGTLSECIGAGVAMLWPPRVGFREDGPMVAEAPAYLRMQEISREDFESGNWAKGLQVLLSSAPPPKRMPSDGDRVCSQVLARWLA